MSLLNICDNRYKQRKQGVDTNVVGDELQQLNPDQVASEEPEQVNQDLPQDHNQELQPTDENLNHGRVQGLEKKTEVQQEEIQKLKNANKDLQQTVEDRNRSIGRLEQAARDRQKLERQKKDLEKRLKSIQEQNERLTAGTVDTSLKLARKETELEDMKKYQSEIGDLNEILKSKEIELKGATTELEYTQKEMNEYKMKCAKLEEDCERYRSKSEESDKKLGEARIFIQVMTDNQATLLSGKGDGKDDQGLGEHLHLLV